MTALSSYRDTKRMGDDVHPVILDLLVADNVHIFKGAIVGLDADDGAGDRQVRARRLRDRLVVGRVAEATDVGDRQRVRRGAVRDLERALADADASGADGVAGLGVVDLRLGDAGDLGADGAGRRGVAARQADE